jgi:hypothetical protein
MRFCPVAQPLVNNAPKHTPTIEIDNLGKVFMTTPSSLIELVS